MLLDYPNKTDPNMIYLMRGEEYLYNSTFQEEGLENDGGQDSFQQMVKVS